MIPRIQPQVCCPHQGGESDRDQNSESPVLQRPAGFRIKVYQHTAWQEKDLGINDVLLRAILAGSLQKYLFSCWRYLMGCSLLCYLFCLPSQSSVKNGSFQAKIHLIATSMAQIDQWTMDVDACWSQGGWRELAQLQMVALHLSKVISFDFSLTFLAIIVLGKERSLALCAAESWTPLWNAICSHNPASIWEGSRNQFGPLPSAKMFKEEKNWKGNNCFVFIITICFEIPAFS